MAASDAGTLSLAAASPASGNAVLVAEDDDVRLFLRGVLRLLHHRVVHEAARLESAADASAASDATILVFALPSGKGGGTQELARVLRARPELRGLVLLAPAQESLRTAALEAGACATVLRPFTLKEFADALQELAKKDVSSLTGSTGSEIGASSGGPTGAA